MKTTFDWKGLIYVVGILNIFLGALDPLEGSLLIVVGSILITLYKYLRGDRHKKGFLAGCILIVVGVGYMFYLSNLGGIGPHAKSWWWIIPVIPYPVGWLLTVVLLFIHASQKWKLRKKN
jgi:hypothetical protein